MQKDELQQQLEPWREFQQSVVDDATDQWQTRLEACVQADGDHFEQCLWRLSKLVFRQTVIILNSACDVCETIFHTIQQLILFRATQQQSLFRATHFFQKKTVD